MISIKMQSNLTCALGFLSFASVKGATNHSEYEDIRALSKVKKDDRPLVQMYKNRAGIRVYSLDGLFKHSNLNRWRILNDEHVYVELEENVKFPNKRIQPGFLHCPGWHQIYADSLKTAYMIHNDDLETYAERSQYLSNKSRLESVEKPQHLREDLLHLRGNRVPLEPDAKSSPLQMVRGYGKLSYARDNMTLCLRDFNSHYTIFKDPETKYLFIFLDNLALGDYIESYTTSNTYDFTTFSELKEIIVERLRAREDKYTACLRITRWEHTNDGVKINCIVPEDVAGFPDEKCIEYEETVLQICDLDRFSNSKRQLRDEMKVPYMTEL